MKTLFGCLGGALYFIILVVVGTILSGLALQQLWIWFITPTFGVRELSVIEALGLALVIGFFTHQEQETKTEKDLTTAIIAATIKVILKPLLYVAFGWVYWQFMPK